MTSWLPWILIAYLVGSIPFGFLIARHRGVDIRRVGSGNVGATNVGRMLGRRFGVACFLLDAVKGAGPVVAAGIVNDVWGRPLSGVAAAPPAALDVWAWLAVAVAALLGHMFPPWLGFKGGKGVATGFGGLLAMWPLLTWPAATALLVWAVTVWLTRIVSLASIIAAASLPLTCLVLVGFAASAAGGAERSASLAAGLPLVAVTVALAALVIVRHRSNLSRIMQGTEPRLGTPR